MVNDRPYVVLDLETTGLSSTDDEIIEVAAVLLESGSLSRTFSSLIRPSRAIPARITDLTGISDDMVKDSPGLSEILPDLIRFMGDSQIVGHNIGFDLGFLKQYVALDVPGIDTLELSRIVLPRMSNHRLQTVARETGYYAGTAHRALDDALMTASVFLNLRKLMQELPLEVITKINRMARGWGWPLASLFGELELQQRIVFPRTKLSGGLLLLPLAAAGGLFGERRSETKPKVAALDPGLAQETLGPGGLLSQKLPGYEYRSQQIEVMASVIRALNEEKHLVMEAGTGSGKSLAYLIPAAYWAAQNGQKVVVSTHTISLQEQLWAKDIPLLREALSVEFRAALVKGRSNYLCLRKWFAVEENIDSFPISERRFFIRLVNWLAGTGTGDRSELNLAGSDLESWRHMAADCDSCAGNRCRWFHDYCFLMRARREAENAQLLVVNHSLLLADLKAENKVLPDHNYLIIDEAHHLEEAATQHLGVSINRDSCLRLLSGLRGDHDGRPGPLGVFARNLERASGHDPSLRSEVGSRMEEARTTAGKATAAASQFFGLVRGGLAADQATDDYGGRVTRRIRPKDGSGDWWLGVEAAGDNLRYHLKALGDSLAGLLVLVEDMETGFGARVGEARDLVASLKAIRELDQAIGVVTNISDDSRVYWVEGDAGKEYGCLSLQAAPIEVARLLSEQVFSRKQSVVLTSATLSVGTSFNHFLERSGLSLSDPERVIVKGVQSPFRYEEQVLLCISSDIPPPAESGDEGYAQAVAPAIRDISLAMGGRVMVLFTSYRLMAEVYRLIGEDLRSNNILLLAQNIDGAQSRLLEEFRKAERGVILGTAGFWEGVDVKGEDLSCVIVVKLPFAPPSMPTVEARMELLQSQRQNGFYHYLLPNAIIRFKQGFGRLIRSGTDRGVVVVLDKRVLDRSYGRHFLASLPIKTHIKGDIPFLVRRIREHMEQGFNRGTFPVVLERTADIPQALTKNRFRLPREEGEEEDRSG